MPLGNAVTIVNNYFKTNFVIMLYLFVGLSDIKQDKYSILEFQLGLLV